MHIEKRGNSLLIKFSHDSKPYSFSLPKHNNPVGMSAAKMKMAQIEKDIAYGNFDTTLLRYKPRKLGNNPTAIMAVELFEKYIPYHQQERGLSHGSGLKLEAIASKLNVCRIRTTSKNPISRLLFVGISFVLVNIWINPVGATSRLQL